MWIEGRAWLAVHWIDSASATTPYKRVVPIASGPATQKTTRLDLSPVELAEAMVRTSLVPDPTRLDLFFDGIANYLRLQRIAVVSSEGNLRFAATRRGQMRDSTETALAGELGQAIAYLVGTKVLGHRQVVDFGRGCQRVGAAAPGHNDERPDFLATQTGFRSSELLESKGSLPRSGANVEWKSGLRGALKQVDAGVIRLAGRGNVARGWAIHSALRTAADQDDSAIALADPDENESAPPTDPARRRLLDLHYAAWLTTIGAMDVVQLLAEPDEADPEERTAVLQGLWIDWRGRRWFLPDPGTVLLNSPWWLGLWGLPVSALWPTSLRAIQRDVAQSLAAGRDLAPGFDWPSPHPTDESDLPGGYVFTDGTAVLLRTEELSNPELGQLTFRR